MAVFPYLVGFLDLCAGVVYFYNRQYALGLTWTCYAVAAVALGSVK